MAGQPTKLTKKMKGQIKVLALKGFTDVEMAEAVGVTERTINNWKKQQPEFFQSLKGWKDQADKKVERALYERACGYKHPETKAQFVDGVWETFDMVKHYPPDSTSMIFWLKNRKKEWSDQQDIKITDESSITSEETLRRLAFMLRKNTEEGKKEDKKE